MTDLDNRKQSIPWLLRTNFGTFRGLVRYLLGEAELLLGRLDGFLRPNLTRTRRLVFVCHGNINRSAFAQVVAQAMHLRAISIGLSTMTGNSAYVRAKEAAERIGLNLEHHRATNFPDYVYEPGDLLLVMEVRHARVLMQRGVPREAITLLGCWARPHRIHIHDPHTLSESYFRSCFAIVQSAVVNLADDLRLHGSSSCIR